MISSLSNIGLSFGRTESIRKELLIEPKKPCTSEYVLIIINIRENVE